MIYLPWVYAFTFWQAFFCAERNDSTGKYPQKHKAEMLNFRRVG